MSFSCHSLFFTDFTTKFFQYDLQKHVLVVSRKNSKTLTSISTFDVSGIKMQRTLNNETHRKNLSSFRTPKFLVMGTKVLLRLSEVWLAVPELVVVLTWMKVLFPWPQALLSMLTKVRSLKPRFLSSCSGTIRRRKSQPHRE